MIACLTPGSLAPAFTLLNAEGTPVSLSDHPSRAVIVYFYPTAMIPGCITQAVDFTGARTASMVADCTIIDISPGTVEKFARFTTSSKTGFSLLSDLEHEVLNAYGTFGTKKLYGREVGGVPHSTSVIGVDAEGNGTIRVTQYSVRVAGHVARLRRGLDV